MTTSKTLRTEKNYRHEGVITRVDIDIQEGCVALNVDQIDAYTGYATRLYFTALYTPVVTDVAGFVKRLDLAMADHRHDILALFKAGAKWTVLEGDDRYADEDPCSEPSDSQIFNQQEDWAVNRALDF